MTKIYMHVWNKARIQKLTLIIMIRQDNVWYLTIAVVKVNDWLQFVDYTIYIGRELFVSLY